MSFEIEVSMACLPIPSFQKTYTEHLLCVVSWASMGVQR